jgi:hypothetical protein
MRSHDDLEDGRFPICEGCLDVALQQRGEGLLGLPLRVFRSQHLDAVEGEQEREIHRLFGPQSAVIVESGDPIAFRHEVGRA